MGIIAVIWTLPRGRNGINRNEKLTQGIPMMQANPTGR
jgi:hypothetical protein